MANSALAMKTVKIDKEMEKMWGELPDVARDGKKIQTNILEFLKNPKKEEFNLVL